MAFFNSEDVSWNRLLNTLLFSDWINNTDLIVANKSNGGLKWLMFSAHDSNL